MNVKALIEILQRFPEDAEVQHIGYLDPCHQPIHNVYGMNMVDGRMMKGTPRQVVLVGGWDDGSDNMENPINIVDKENI